jgi:formyl-CoA transferase
MYMTGEPDRPPQRVGLPVCDYTSGIWGALGVLLSMVGALRAREHGQEPPTGQTVDHPIYASFLPMLRDLASIYDLTGEIGDRSGNRSTESAPGEAYLTRDGRWLFIAVTGDRVFAMAMAAIGRPELVADPRFADGAGRLRHRAVLDQTMTDWVLEHDLADVLAILHEAGVPASPVHSIADLLADEHAVARQDFVRMPYEKTDVLMPAPLPRLSHTPGSLRRRAPRLGEHTDEVLRELAVENGQVDQARAAGAFGPTDVRKPAGDD